MPFRTGGWWTPSTNHKHSRYVTRYQSLCRWDQPDGGRKLSDPHLDNSNDKDRERYRVLNLLYYVTPDWQPEYGGNLELWDGSSSGQQRTIYSKFNRLVLMATTKTSWHSVSKVVGSGQRCCLFNYYFSPRSSELEQFFHVTSFRSRPNEPVRDRLLQGDAALRMVIRKAFKKGIVENPHVYKKQEILPS